MHTVEGEEFMEAVKQKFLAAGAKVCLVSKLRDHQFFVFVRDYRSEGHQFNMHTAGINIEPVDRAIKAEINQLVALLEMCGFECGLSRTENVLIVTVGDGEIRINLDPRVFSATTEFI